MIGIICAMEIEAESFKALMQDTNVRTISGVTYIQGFLWGRETVIAVCGIGKVNAAVCAQTMILSYNPDFIINSGVAGGLDLSLKICDFVVADFVVQHDMDTSPVGDPLGFISGIDLVSIPTDKALCELLFRSINASGNHGVVGTIASGDQFINSNEKREFIIETFGASACEMESASIGQVCFLNKIPFAILRSISDNADGTSDISYNQFVKLASESTVSVMEKFYLFLD